MSKIIDLLGNKASYYLDHTCKTIDKSLIHVPSQDTVDKIWINSVLLACVIFNVNSCFISLVIENQAFPPKQWQFPKQ